MRVLSCLVPLLTLFCAGRSALAAAPADEEAVVSRHDTVYTTPSPEPWEAMPTGGGDLSAMVRWDGSLHLHLSKSDAWGFQAPADAPPGSRFFNNVSPGHLRIDFGPKSREAAARWFRQRLDLYRGRVVVQLGGERGPRIEVWGHPELRLLVIEVIDSERALEPPKVELSEWRPTMQVSVRQGGLHAREVHSRAARPHLANTGMQDFFPADRDPLLGRGTAVVVEGTAASVLAEAVDTVARFAVSLDHPGSYQLLVAAAVTPSGDPSAAALDQLSKAKRAGIEKLRAEQRAWWKDYWGRATLQVSSPDRKADRLSAAWHVHLYTLGCVNRGPYPAKWDGGPGLMRGDERNWGLSEWVQETRFTYLPLYAANRLEMARALPRHYSAMRPYLEAQTRTMWDKPGLWIPETTLPWGHAEDFVLKDDGRGAGGSHYQRRDGSRIPYGRFERFNPYVGFLFTSGLEVCQHYLLYHRFSGDEAFLREDAYPVLRGVCQFIASLLRKEADGRMHLDPANALETWWLVRDPADTLAGIRAIFPQFIRLSAAYGEDAELRTRCESILASLADWPRGHWSEDGKIDARSDLYAPADSLRDRHPRSNAENPALYRVFPFELSGIGSADYDLACRTFERRIASLGNGWSMDALWAARLGRPEACALLAQHAQQFHRYRYGGWTSNDSQVFPGRLSACPFLDAGGLSAAALQEVLLQSHGGLIRILPAVANDWSGAFRLRAEGGFLVSATFRGGKPQSIEIQSLEGWECRLASPCGGRWTVRQAGRLVAQGAEPRIHFSTTPGAAYRIDPQPSE